MRTHHHRGGFGKAPDGLVNAKAEIEFTTQSTSWLIGAATAGHVTYACKNLEVTVYWDNPFIGSNSSRIILAGPDAGKFTAVASTGAGSQKAHMRYELFENEA
jgi:hypothetical protein